MDARISARPVAEELKRLAPESLPVAVFDVKRETEYGLAFYRNQVVASYETGVPPRDEHLLVTPAGIESKIAVPTGDRKVERLGSFAPQGLELYRVGKQR